MKRSLEIARYLIERMESEVECHKHSAKLSDFSAFPGLSIAVEALLEAQAEWPPDEESQRRSLHARYGAAFDFEFRLRTKPKR